MSYYWLEGYDVYPNTSDTQIGLANLWYVDGGASMVVGRFGGRGVQIARGSANGIQRTFAASGTGPISATVGFAFKTDVTSGNIGTGNTIIAQFVNGGIGGTQIGGVALTPTFNLAYYTTDPTAPVFTSSITISSDVWYYVELAVFVNATAGTINVAVNGTSFGIYTGALGSVTPDTVNFVAYPTDGSNVGNFFYDDTYVASGTTFLGAQRVETLVPNSDALGTGWTPSTGTALYPMVNELPVDGGATYISQTVFESAEEYFTTAGLSGAPVSISCLQQRVCAQSDANGSGFYGYVANDLSTDGTFARGSPHTLTSNYGYYLDLWPQQPTGTYPYTFTPWTYANVNSANPGVDTGD